MSTKTTFKRIALVAVAALGFGTLSVAPSQAATGAVVFDPSQTAVTVTAGVASSVPIVITTVNGDAANNDAIRVTASVGAGVPVTIGAGTTTGSTLDVTATGAAQGWALSVGTGWVQALAGSTAGTGTAKTATDGKILGNVVFTPTAVGLFTITLTGSGAGSTFAATKTITVNAVAGANAGLNSFITTATTVDTPGNKADGNATTAYAVSNSTTDLAANAPGVAKATNGGGRGTSSIASLTVPSESVIVFTVEPTNNVAYSANSQARLTLNGSTWATTTLSAADPGVVGSITAPATAGTYTAVLVISGSQGSFDPSVTESIPFTLTVGSVASNKPDFGNTSATTELQVTGTGVSRVGASGRVGVPVSFAPTFTVRNGTAGTLDTNTRSARLLYTLTLPAGTAGSLVDAPVAGVATTSQTVNGKSDSLTTLTSNATPTVGTLTYFIPATAGTYTVTVIHDANRNGVVDALEASSQSTFVIAADGTPTITFTQFGSVGEQVDANDERGRLVRISLRNGTAAANLATNEVLTLTGTDVQFDGVSTVSSAGVQSMDGTVNGNGTITIPASAFNGLGDAYINVYGLTHGTLTVNASITGGTAGGASGSFAFTVLRDKTTTVAKTATAVPGTYSNENALKGVFANADLDLRIKRGTSTAVKVGFLPGAGAAGAGKSYYALVTDTEGLITGLKGAQYTMVTSTSDTAANLLADTVASFSVTIPATTLALPTGTDVATLTTLGANATTPVDAIVIKSENAAPKYTYVNPAQTASTFTIRAGAATTNTFTVTSTDQFGNALPNITYTGAITGRNSTTVLPVYVTNASGQFTVSLTDTYTGGALSVTDAILLTATTGSSTATFTINYAAYLPVSKVTMTTPDSANATLTGIAGQIKTDISSLDGAEEGAVAVSAVLTDANGGTLPAGIPVTFSVAGTGVAILSTHVTVYTDSTGKATSSVYGWVTGNRVVTATAGTISATGTVYFEQTAAAAGVQAEARTIAAKAAGNLVTATVTDRFGNGISGISVIATRVGTGTFNGTSSLTGVTDKAGEVQFVLTNGTADVTVSFTSPTFGASAATKGFKDAGITALTAYTAGTTVLAEEGVGASFDAAGVNSATVLAVSDTATIDQAAAATDAAAEATDAANAATDAANAAAEAADAATAAAQDAADAVAALSTQVSEMVDALKKQITALTNLVIKIQKKVKA
jgi:trimeric autotransporter adhesin